MSTVIIKQSEIVTQTIERALRSLTITGCRFVVISPDGTRHVYGQVDDKPPIKRRRSVNAGAYSAVYKPLIDALQVGGVAMVPAGDNPEGMRSSVTAYCSGLWGKGTYTSCIADGHVQILREA